MKLHELLALEGPLENQANTCRGELAATFEKKRHLFEEKRSVFISLAEGAPAVTEAQSDIQSTIQKELDWIQGFLVKSWDASYQVAEANTQARADIVLEDGTTLAKDVPATALLELEKRCAEVLALVKAVPTLDPAKGFTPDSDRGPGYYKAREVRKNRTQKVKEVIVLYPATPEHPAQTQLIDKDVPTGTLQEQEWSALITPAAKAELIGRAEMVSRAVRQARSRANDVTVDTSKKIGKALLSYIFSK